MYQGISRLHRALFGIGVAASLAFGTTRALAAPKSTGESARNCNPAQCDRICKAQQFAGGICLAHDKLCYCY